MSFKNKGFKLKKVIIPYIRYYLNYKRINKTTPPREENNLAITAIVKNEVPYIIEWLEFHKLVGVKKFYLYDNESNDGLKEKIKSYIDSGEVEYTYFPGKKMQLKAYNDSLNKNRFKCKYMAFIDIDEFIVPIEYNNINDFIESLEASSNNGIDAIGINWLMHGYNGHYNKQNGLITEIYKKCEFNSFLSKSIKTIVKTRSAVCVCNPHFCLCKFSAKVVDADGGKMYGPTTDIPHHNKIRINHYYTKSYEEYVLRLSKGKADGAKVYPAPEYNPDFYSIDNDCEIDRYLPKLKEKMQSELSF